MHADYQTVAQLQTTQRLLDHTWVSVPTESPVIGHTLQELDIRNRTGATIVAVLNSGNLIPNPNGGYCFQPGDIVGVLGSQQQRTAFQELVKASAALVDA